MTYKQGQESNKIQKRREKRGYWGSLDKRASRQSPNIPSYWAEKRQKI